MYKGYGHIAKTGREASFLKTLEKGVKVSVKQAQAWFDLKNPPAAILRFRQAGLQVDREYKRKYRSKIQTVTYSL